MLPKRNVDFYGDQVRWFVGEVKNINDPLELGRIQVRVHGIHSDSQLDIPDANLPWAQAMVPITQGGTAGYGNNLGIQVGSLVFGLFMDGENSQLPFIMGSMPKFEESTPGGLSTNQLARGTNTLTERKVTKGTDPTKIANLEPFDEPNSPYNAIYPLNYAYETPRGNVIEIDDSYDSDGDYSRIHIYHRSGSFVEMHPNGDVVTHHKNGFKTVHGNDKVYITGDLEITVNGDMNLTVKGDLTENITGNMDTNVTKDITTDGKTINLNSGVNGAARIGDTADTGDQGTGSHFDVNSAGTNIIETGSQTVFIGD